MKKLLIILSVLFVCMVSCSKDDDTKNVDNHDQHTSKNTVEEKEAPEKPASIYPFTGKETNEEITNRAITVMVNNHPKARPQTGLSKADIVFEILAEGNITRFMALFQSNIPDRVGPVRSARPYYFNLADDYNAIYVYHGAANFIEDMIQNGAAQGLNGMYHDNDKVLFERSNDRVAPHNSYTIFDGIYTNAEKQGYDLTADYQPLDFNAGKEVSGDAAEEIQLSYGNNSVKYVYDNDHYIRYSDGVQTVEHSDQTPISLQNVLIIETAHKVVDSAGRREIDLDSGGNALLLQQGKVERVQWERNDGRIIPTKDGIPVPFIPGQTWINVIPNTPGIDGVKLTNVAD